MDSILSDTKRLLVEKILQADALREISFLEGKFW